MDVIIACIVGVHVALTPLVVFATNRVLGYQDALTLANQRTWTPIISAQSILLAVYLAYGPGRLARRVSWFALGCAALCVSVVAAYSLLQTFPEPWWLAFAYQLRTNSLWILIPTVVPGLTMTLVRPKFGEVRRPSQSPSLQFSLVDLFVVTTVAAVATAWFSYVANVPLEASNAQRIGDVIPILPLLQWSAWRVGMSMSATWAVFSERFWFLGLLVLLVLIGAQVGSLSMTAVLQISYTWAVVFLTLAVYRLHGYRLLRG